jgi:cardiolipin synthase
MANIGAAKSVAVSLIGKLKTIAQMTAIPMLLWHAADRVLDICCWAPGRSGSRRC